MWDKIESFLLNKLAGKLLARAAVTVAGYIASTQVQALLGQAGVHGVQVDPAELTTGMVALFHAGFEWFKARRMKNPASPAVQTDKDLLPAPAPVDASLVH